MTYLNASFNGTSANGYTTYLDSGADLTVTATFYELSPNIDNDIKLYYNGSDGVNMVSEKTLYGDLSTKNATIVTPSPACIRSALGSYAGGYSIPITCTWTIPAGTATDSGGTNNETVVFGFHINDTFNNVGNWNDTSAIVGGFVTPFSILTNETLPYVSVINITDQKGNYLDGTSGKELDGSRYLASTTTIRFEVTGGPRAVTNITSGVPSNGWVVLYYNVTGTGGLDINNGNADAQGQLGGVIELYDGITTNITQFYNVTTGETDANLKDSSYTSFYSVDLGAGGNKSGNTIEFAIVIGNTSMDNQNGNYTRTMGPYSYIMDRGAPVISISRVTDSPSITQSDSVGVTYKCTASDISGIQKYVWTLKKPSGDADSITSTSTDTSNTITFEGSEINELGAYEVKCVVYDNVDNYDTSGVRADGSNGFTVNAPAGTSGPSTGGPGGAAISFDVDFTTANEGSIKSQQGRIKSFSFDGVTQHTVTFMTVTADSATLKIESTPVTITLNVGETKDVDVNADGTNDMSVKLNAIVNSVADVTIKKIEEGAAKVVAEEETARGVEPTVTTPVEGAGLAWLWWLIGIIVVVGLGYYFFFKKK